MVGHRCYKERRVLILKFILAVLKQAGIKIWCVLVMTELKSYLFCIWSCKTMIHYNSTVVIPPNSTFFSIEPAAWEYCASMFILLGPSTKKSINLSPPRKTYNTKLNNSLLTCNKLVRKNMDVSEHERLSNITLGYKSKWMNSVYVVRMDMDANEYERLSNITLGYKSK